MKQKHFFVLLLAIVFTAFFANTSQAHPHGRFNHCNRGANYGYRYMPPPPPPPMYYGYMPPRHFHHHRPHHYYRGYGQRW
ncbi:MAG: hypothetical protein RL708_731 [Bacteroidota bacterium]